MASPKVDWLVLIPDNEGALEKRLKARPEHMDGLKPRVDSGAWVLGGATLSTPPRDGEDKKYTGSCIVARASSREEVLEEIRRDVYAKEGVWNLEKVCESL
ncbi:hypothetical protein Z517_02874 [Fonsecaea pedrosoi CBS 271.37]|uniref:YCII-related domain-containing protein n=1 Tax=Fonsecaea pedrosoi CBS 271.37 TaxID=1442368 RepID=A0A0D2GRN1_9EURO|nr:uncharacterized protein Z517_02874 [Fonsecaea pedrosoi CBS 271.37]KIW83628.1 hypothetical protein Z517_02874 [Fonsecaea pedrosoi CBS 271.37]